MSKRSRASRRRGRPKDVAVNFGRLRVLIGQNGTRKGNPIDTSVPLIGLRTDRSRTRLRGEEDGYPRTDAPLPWFGSLERALQVLDATLGQPAIAYPSEQPSAP
jgi:hypothetical protein